MQPWPCFCRPKLSWECLDNRNVIACLEEPDCTLSPCICSLSQEEAIWQTLEQKLPNDLSFHNLLLLKGKPLAGAPVLGENNPLIGHEMIARKKTHIARLQAGAFKDLNALQKARLSVLAILNTGKSGSFILIMMEA